MYRNELDGLRALSIAAVLLNHANSAWLPGGFLGVDSFFVLSGYVVAKSWTNKTRTPSKLSFYTRRLRRLQPALIVMLITSVALSWPADLLNSVNQLTATSSLIGISNITLFSQSLDYFGQAAESNPFTHTWSLGIEEQFYLLLPFLIYKKNLTRWLIAFSTCLWIILQIENPEAAFYLMPSRFWELGIGIYMATSMKGVLHNTQVQWLSLIVIISGFNMPLNWQLWSTPTVVIGTTCLIQSLNKSSQLKSYLSSQPIRSFGLLAYGLYLWHWPLMVIARAVWPDEVLLNCALPLGLTTIIAWLSYKWLEQPLRKAQWGFKIGIPIITAATAIIGGIGFLNNELRSSLSYDEYSKSQRERLESQECHSRKDPDALKHCLPNSKKDEPSKLILIGDSHAAHLKPALKSINVEIEQLTDRNLPNLWLGRSCKEPDYCFTENIFLEQLKKTLTPGSVVILGLSPRRITGPNKSSSDSIKSIKHLEQSLEKLISLVAIQDSRLLLVKGLPQLKCPKEKPFYSLFNHGGSAAVIEACNSDREWAEARNELLSNLYTKISLKYSEYIEVFDPLPLLCSKSRCPDVGNQKKLLYWDDLAHLTPEGLSHIEEELRDATRTMLRK